MNDWTVYERVAFVLFAFGIGVILGYVWRGALR